MTDLIVFFLIALAILLIYFFIVRPILKTQPVLSDAFKAEAAFLDKVRAKVTGWRTRIVARLLWIAGLLVGLYDQALPFVMGQDWTPLTAKLPSWSLPVGLVLIAMLIERLKKMTKNAPTIITQRDETTGVAQVVNVVKPAG